MVKTNYKVDVPLNIPYDLITGGACRDVIVGDKVEDYDLFFVNKEKYTEALNILTSNKFNCEKVWTNFFEFSCTCTTWKLKNIKFDVFLHNGHIKDIIDFVMNSFDFSVNCCYQLYGESVIIRKDADACFKTKTLEVVKPKGLYSIIQRVSRFKNKGWKVGGSVAQYGFLRINQMFKEPEKFKDEEKRYVGTGNDYEYTIRTNDLWPSFFQILEDDYLILGFLSDNDDVLKATKKEYDIRNEKKTLKGKLRKIKIIISGIFGFLIFVPYLGLFSFISLLIAFDLYLSYLVAKELYLIFCMAIVN